MKHWLSILILFAALCFPRSALAFDLVISNNAIICGFGDSEDTDGSAPSTGFHRMAYLHSYFVLNYPQFHLNFYDFGRSGGTMDDRLTNSIHPNGLACWGFQSNDFQHLGISWCTSNGNLDSNQMYLAQSNVIHTPVIMSDGAAALNTQTGWAATHPVQWIIAGSTPSVVLDSGDSGGTASPRNQDAGCTNVGNILGTIGIGLFNPLVPSWTNDVTVNQGNTVGFFKGSAKEGHIAAPGQLNETIVFLQQITTDTNISTCVVDFNSAIHTVTNHCVISGETRTGKTLTFNRLDDRLPMAYDISSSDPTNNAVLAFSLIPSQADAFLFTIKLTNCPVGFYNVFIDGVLVTNSIPSSVLTSVNGWNMFTCTTGPYWNQRTEVLGRIRDFEGVDRVTRVPVFPTYGLNDYGSQAFSKWSSGFKGDDTIAQLNDVVAGLHTNSFASADQIHAAAQPTIHTFSITLIATLIAPFHR